MTEDRFFVAKLAQQRLRTAKVQSAFGDNLILNRCTEILFDLATCQTQCRQGDHILEALCGKIVNQSVSTIMLDSAGFHDEAFSLVRSIGEIVNLFAMFRRDPSSYPKWCLATESQRIKDFGPAKVRRAIEGREAVNQPPMDHSTYSKLSGSYVHATPQSKPNAHNDPKQAHVGGYHQETVSEAVASALTEIVVLGALLATNMFQRPELFASIRPLIDDLSTSEPSGA